jgi:demethylmenaquinone methyltransferase/2-methoxy-6-polyprenyl-1,4-benzoquinol methylase
VATGTCDFALEMRRRTGPDGLIVGADFCEPMLRMGLKKTKGQALLLQGDALQLPFPDDCFDASTMGFALRNVADIQQTLNEMSRVVKPGGRVVQLELAKPNVFFFKQLYYLYFQFVLPLIGKVIHGNRENYAYLPASLREFPPRNIIVSMMEKAGLQEVICEDMFFGSVAIYAGTKKR